MGCTVTTRGTFPMRAWDRQAMRQLAKAARTLVIARTFREGRGTDDRVFRPYSTKPRTVSFASDTGRRLKPKGGQPAYGPGHPRRLLVNGRPPRGGGWKITGRHYEGGYAEYKGASRKGIGAPNPEGLDRTPTTPTSGTHAPVDLTLSGQLQRDFRVKRVGATDAILGLTGGATVYGYYTNQDRPWLGLSPGDMERLRPALMQAVAGAMKRSERRR